jgi:hypothetical protein
VERTAIGPEPTLPIVPTYMKEPDLEKSWLLPDEFSENKVEKVIQREKAKDLLAKDINGVKSEQQQTKSDADLVGGEGKNENMMMDRNHGFFGGRLAHIVLFLLILCYRKRNTGIFGIKV